MGHIVAVVVACDEVLGSDQSMEHEVSVAERVDLCLGERSPLTLLLAKLHDDPGSDIGFHVAKCIVEVGVCIDMLGADRVGLAFVGRDVDLAHVFSFWEGGKEVGVIEYDCGA